jgi:hypothetical protein
MKRSHKRPSRHRQSANALGPTLLVLGGMLLIGLTAFLFWRGNAASFTPEVTGAPRLKADREEVNLGDVRLGQTVQVSFEISNVGDKPLRFTGEPYVEVVEGC